MQQRPRGASRRCTTRNARTMATQSVAYANGTYGAHAATAHRGLLRMRVPCGLDPAFAIGVVAATGLALVLKAVQYHRELARARTTSEQENTPGTTAAPDGAPDPFPPHATRPVHRMVTYLASALVSVWVAFVALLHALPPESRRAAGPLFHVGTLVVASLACMVLSVRLLVLGAPPLADADDVPDALMDIIVHLVLPLIALVLFMTNCDGVPTPGAILTATCATGAAAAAWLAWVLSAQVKGHGWVYGNLPGPHDGPGGFVTTLVMVLSLTLSPLSLAHFKARCG